MKVDGKELRTIWLESNAKTVKIIDQRRLPHELVLVDDEMRSMISRSAAQHELLRHATKLGYRSLRYDGLKKVLLGLTSIEEIEKHTVLEWDPAMAMAD